MRETFAKAHVAEIMLVVAICNAIRCSLLAAMSRFPEFRGGMYECESGRCENCFDSHSGVQICSVGSVAFAGGCARIVLQYHSAVLNEHFWSRDDFVHPGRSRSMRK